MNIVGRKDEIELLNDALLIEKPEFIAVYGRRRVGKTYLIKEYFDEDFSFYATGVPNLTTRKQLRVFHGALKQYGCKEKRLPSDWFEAFERLRELLESDRVNRNAESNKRVVFLDEVPWMAGPKSDFKAALDLFWNSYASTKKDILLIICGSATSWIIDNVINDTGGFHNRLTNTIHLMPMSLLECYDLSIANNLNLTRDEVALCYMVLGGIPYYFSLLKNRYSVHQNIDNLLFKENGQLHNEFNSLFSSLFKKHENHIAIVLALSNSKNGLLRSEIMNCEGVTGGISLTRALKELEQCGFIRKYRNFITKKNDSVYQLIDPFTLFAIKFLNNQRFDSWLSFTNTPGFYNWRGNAFETIAFNHVKQIKKALGVYGVETMEYAFKSKKTKAGSQIDLVIDRKDGVTNICELKYADEEYVIDDNYRNNLMNKIQTFGEESKTRSSIHLTLLTSCGIVHNQNSRIINEELTLDDLFI